MKKIILSLITAGALFNANANDIEDVFKGGNIFGSGGNNTKAFARHGTGHLGGFKAKWGSSSFNLVHIEPPHMKAGCNGIDIGFGGMSFISFEELKEKASMILKNAQGYAFKLALSTLCKECDAVLSSLEEISNMINSMNFDTCDIATKGVDKLVGLATGKEVANGEIKDWEWSKDSQKRAESVNKFMDDWVTEPLGKFSDVLGGNKEQRKAATLGYGSLLHNVYTTTIEKQKNKPFGIEIYEDFCKWVALIVGQDLLIETKDQSGIQAVLYNTLTLRYGGSDVITKPTEAFQKAIGCLSGDNSCMTYKRKQLKGVIHTFLSDGGKENVAFFREGKEVDVNMMELYKPIKDYLYNSFYHTMGTMLGIYNNYKLSSEDIEFLNSFPADIKDTLNGIVYLNLISSSNQTTFQKCLKDLATRTNNTDCTSLSQQVDFYVREYLYQIAIEQFLDFFGDLEKAISSYQLNKAFDPATDTDKASVRSAIEQYVKRIEERKKEFLELLQKSQEEIALKKQELREQIKEQERLKKQKAEEELQNENNK